MTDHTLIQAAKRGDPEAFRQLVLPLEQRYCHIALSVTGNSHDALDAWQNALIRAWKQLPKLRDLSGFRSWIAAIVLNESKTIVRKRGKAPVPLETVPEQAAGTLDSESSLAVRECLRQLPMEQREAVVLRFWLDLPLKEIASITRVPLNTSKARLYRGIDALHDLLEEKPEGGEVVGRQGKRGESS